MIIGIDASRAFLKRRTGIEEYAFQVIKHLRDEIPESEEVILYVRKKITFEHGWLALGIPDIGFTLPSHWRIRGIWAPRFWTQIGLSLEMIFRKPDILFVPAHTIPLVHPRNTLVTVHGLEYEFCPESYSWWSRIWLRIFTRYSCKMAKRVIAVSENTKRDIVRLYGISEERIKVVYEGYESSIKYQVSGIKYKAVQPYLLFVGRLEERKNVGRIIDAFEILKEKHDLPYKLVLAGKPGYGYEKIQRKIQGSKFKSDIQELGYVTEEEKWELLKNADVFVFPSLYEGFGLPILEAQSAGVPVVTSRSSSLPEVGGGGAVYVEPYDAQALAFGIERALPGAPARDVIIKKAKENLKNFSWQATARAIAGMFMERNE